ncbi:MAG: hypothetical protein PUF65_01210 [Lachnospiraceae bacterium]|nr:hypothetical protein [Lachnospiraceae bacterium]
MDMQRQPYNFNTGSERMEMLSLLLASVAMISCTCLYLSIPCGALAIIFASLSRGGRMHYGTKAQIALILGSLALAFTALLYTISIVYVIYRFGSLEAYMNYYSNMDYNELLQELMTTTQFP